MVTAKESEHLSLKEILIGKPLATYDLPHQAVSKVVGLAVFASDALSSTAYATEEILVVLAFAGAGYFNTSIPIALAICTLLVIVTLSYRQTIYAYPNGGGAYIVARDNLGELPAQIAGAALLTDYILTVAVSISSGVQQITSGLPFLRDFRVELALLVIIGMTIVNLRGVKESGRIFAVPTYFFLGLAFLMIGVGGYQYLTGQLNPIMGVQMLKENVLEPIGWFLILRAFSSGCTALTGIEAISNGITAFKEPKSKNAAVTLTWMSGVLIILFLGFTLLANQIHALPSADETVISQLARALYGFSPLYFLTLVGTALILLMAANTSYADFPRLAALHAGDGFLPRQLTIRGSRLVFSTGIVMLGILASLLVVFFHAEVSALIPLYAIGVFLSFTMSQTGMVVRTWKIGHMKPGDVLKTTATTLQFDAHWKPKIVLSALGATVTGIVMVVFAVTKFAQGAWFIVLLIPCLVYGFFRIHYHYRDVARMLSASDKKVKRIEGPVQSLVFIEDVHAGTLRMIDYARSACCPWKAIHIAADSIKAELVRKKWLDRVGDDAELIIIPSPYRELIGPIRDCVEAELAKSSEGFINVIFGHLATNTAWEQALHQNNAFIFNLALQGLERVAVTNVPYQIRHLHQNGNGHKEGEPSIVHEKDISSTKG